MTQQSLQEGDGRRQIQRSGYDAITGFKDERDPGGKEVKQALEDGRVRKQKLQNEFLFMALEMRFLLSYQAFFPAFFYIHSWFLLQNTVLSSALTLVLSPSIVYIFFPTRFKISLLSRTHVRHQLFQKTSLWPFL